MNRTRKIFLVAAFAAASLFGTAGIALAGDYQNDGDHDSDHHHHHHHKHHDGDDDDCDSSSNWSFMGMDFNDFFNFNRDNDRDHCRRHDDNDGMFGNMFQFSGGN